MATWTALAGTIVVAMIVTVVLAVRAPWTSVGRFTPIVMGLLCVAVLDMLTGAVGSLVQLLREERAGYTTLSTPFMPQLDQVDPRSGKVVRRSGEPLPKHREYVERRARLRAGGALD
jgi:hypothetical protein